jgi:hypothetical protein
MNLGIFVEDILSRPDLTSNGKFVLGKVDILSAVDYIKLWGKVTGNEVTGQRPITAEDLGVFISGLSGKGGPCFQFLASRTWLLHCFKLRCNWRCNSSSKSTELFTRVV